MSHQLERMTFGCLHATIDGVGNPLTKMKMFMRNADNILIRKLGAAVKIDMNIGVPIICLRFPKVMKTRMTRRELLYPGKPRRLGILSGRDRHRRKRFHPDGIQKVGKVLTRKCLGIALIQHILQSAIQKKEFVDRSRMIRGTSRPHSGLHYPQVMPVDPNVPQFFGKTKETKIK